MVTRKKPAPAAKPKPPSKPPVKPPVKRTVPTKSRAPVKKALPLKKPRAKPAPKAKPKPKAKAKARPTTKPAPAPAPIPAEAELPFILAADLRFVEEYIIDLNGTQAYLRVHPEVTIDSAGTMSSRLLGKVEIKRAVLVAMEARSVRTGITADRVLQELWGVATADTRELIQYQKGCCRCCWGKDSMPQRTETEMRRDRIRHDADQVVMKQKDRAHKIVEFDEAGGIGYTPHRPPNVECPECWGVGVGRPVIADTRTLSKEGALLYAGVKQTKDGLEVKLHSKLDALDKIAKHLGIYEKDNKQVGEGVANGLASLLKSMKRSSLPVVLDPDAE